MASVLIGFAGGARAGDDAYQAGTLGKFDRISLSGVYELNVTVGGAFSVEVTGPERELERVKTWVKDGTLHFERREEFWNFFHDDSVSIRISMPSLRGLDISGVIDGNITGIDADRFDLDISGVGDLDLSGTCNVLNADVSGVGDLSARKLECRHVVVDISGIGDATFFASEEADADISGIGDVSIHGSPARVRKNASMFSDISVH